MNPDTGVIIVDSGPGSWVPIDYPRLWKAPNGDAVSWHNMTLELRIRLGVDTPEPLPWAATA